MNAFRRSLKVVIIFGLTTIFFFLFGKPSLESYFSKDVVIKESNVVFDKSPSITICPMVENSFWQTISSIELVGCTSKCN